MEVMESLHKKFEDYTMDELSKILSKLNGFTVISQILLAELAEIKKQNKNRK